MELLNRDTMLNAINEMLASIGESPIDTLENNDNTDVMSAIRILSTVSREVQEEEWSFNTLVDVTLEGDQQTGYIPWSDTYLRVYGMDGKYYQERGGVLFCLDDHTSLFTAPIKVKLVVELPFNELPTACRRFIEARASRLFSSRFLGDSAVTQQLYEEEQRARAMFFSYEIDRTRPSMANNTEVTQIMSRG